VTTVVVIVEPWRLALTSTPSIGPSSIEVTYPVKATDPKRRNPAAPVIDMEQVIVDLEDKLKEIETQLQTATVNQDFEAMTRLGEEHISTQSRLEKSLADWDT